ncbi:hypothetical protein GCM10027589_24270 [Actinocorallia lasiicapitis]
MYGGKKPVVAALPFTGIESMQFAFLAIGLMVVGLVLVRLAMVRHSGNQ